MSILPRSSLILVALVLFAAAASAQLVNEPTGEYWPMAQGNTWVYSNVTNDYGATTTIQIASNPTSWGCSVNGPQPNAAIDVYFTKSDASTYWNPPNPQYLHWMLGNDPQANLFSWGWWVYDYSQQMPAGSTDIVGDTYGFPGYMLLTPTVSENQDMTAYQSSLGHSGNYSSCIGGTPPPGTSWQVVWNSATVNTTAYNGNTLQAFYDEEQLQEEQWYFAKQIGVVEIYEDTIGGEPYVLPDPPYPTKLALQSYSVIGLYANDRTYLVAPVGTAVNYEWFAKFFPSGQLNSYSSTYTVDTADDCGNLPNHNYTWAISSPTGSTQANIATCQGTYQGVPTGHTYTINYNGTDNSSNTYDAVLTIVVPPYGTPSPILTANGGKSVSVNIGDTISFAWSDASGLGTSASSNYYVDQADGCGSAGYPTQNTWVASSLSGTSSGTIAACQGGRTYTINYVVNDSNGNYQSTNTATVYVNAGAPSAQLSVSDSTDGQSCNTNNCQITAHVGDNVSYQWTSSNGFWVLSYFSVNTNDGCGDVTGKNYPWFANNYIGSNGGAIATCESGTTYSITYEIGGQGGSTTSSTVNVQVQ